MKLCVVCGARVRSFRNGNTCSADCTARRDRKGRKRELDPGGANWIPRHEMFEPVNYGARRRVFATE